MLLPRLPVQSVNHPTTAIVNTGNRFGGDPAVGAWVTMVWVRSMTASSWSFPAQVIAGRGLQLVQRIPACRPSGHSSASRGQSILDLHARPNDPQGSAAIWTCWPAQSQAFQGRRIRENSMPGCPLMNWLTECKWKSGILDLKAKPKRPWKRMALGIPRRILRTSVSWPAVSWKRGFALSRPMPGTGTVTTIFSGLTAHSSAPSTSHRRSARRPQGTRSARGHLGGLVRVRSYP